MHPWIAVVAIMDIRYTVYADTRSKARFKVWKSAHEAGYKLTFGEINIRRGEA